MTTRQQGRTTVGSSLSRRRVFAWGAAGAAGAALPLVATGPAAADPPDRERDDDRSGLGRIFDVTHFGAKGDGVTIDSDAINRAIDAAAKAGRGPGGGPGGTVYFPAGTYASYSIRLKSNVGLYLGQNATILAAAPAGGKGYDLAEPGAGNPFQDFGILPTGVDNFRIDGLVIDTNRDGINVDCCKNVRISNTTVNSPNDDAIVLKSSYALNVARATENVTIDNCMVSGYDLGTLLDGTFKTAATFGRTGRIKFGTESNGGVRNNATSNVLL